MVPICTISLKLVLVFASNPILLSFSERLLPASTLPTVLVLLLDCQYDGLDVVHLFLLNRLLGGCRSLREYCPPKKQEERSTLCRASIPNTLL